MTTSRPTSAVTSGLLVVDKPAGWTSHQVVGRVRRLAGTRKVGHAGTLDPMATGVLLVGVERATRLLGHLALTSKSYAATVRLGVATVTDDAEGEVVARTPVAGLDPDRLAAALAPLRGQISQVPSAVSAIKVNGVRAYAKVRAGESVTLPARTVRIDRLDVLARRDLLDEGQPVVDLDIVVDCTSGTYIRAIARDLGSTLGVGGHLTALRRTRVGPFGIAESRTLEQLETGPTTLPLADVACRCFETLTLTSEQAAAVRHGRRLPGLPLPGEPTAVFAPDGEFLALYATTDGDARPVAVFSG